MRNLPILPGPTAGRKHKTQNPMASHSWGGLLWCTASGVFLGMEDTQLAPGLPLALHLRYFFCRNTSEGPSYAMVLCFMDSFENLMKDVDPSPSKIQINVYVCVRLHTCIHYTCTLTVLH